MVLAILAGVVVAGVVGAVLFSLFFDGLDDFLECVRYYFTPDIVSLFRGEYSEDRWSEIKLGVWIALSIGSGVLTYFWVLKHFGTGG